MGDAEVETCPVESMGAENLSDSAENLTPSNIEDEADSKSTCGKEEQRVSC